MSAIIRIGTRRSPLAMLQAQNVEKLIRETGRQAEIIPIDSAGDIDLQKPIYELGITGVFTKNLDIALLNQGIDIAVHSLKDVPTQLPQGIVLNAVLPRDYPEDVIVWNKEGIRDLYLAKIGTGSLRRQAFMRNTYASIQCENIRGNVQTRLQRMKERKLDGVIFSLAGLKRLDLDLEYETLKNLIPAPGQGVIAICSREGEFQELLSELNDKITFRNTWVERQFLQTLEGGCTAPIGAYAFQKEDEIIFTAAVCDVEGEEKMEISENFPILEFENKGKELAEILMEQGAQRLFPKTT